MEMTTENKQLIEEMPFLLPRNSRTDEVEEDYDYSYTELDMAEVPEGWKQYLLPLARQITTELKKEGSLKDYRIVQIKEKYNTLRWYASNTTKEIKNIIDYYSDLCHHTCYICGSKARWETRGWFASYCDDCYRKFFDENPKEVCYDFEKEENI